MFKNLDPQDVSKKSFQTFKNFTFNNNDSGSGVFAVKARSGSLFNYVSSSDDFIGITSGSVTTNYFSSPTTVTNDRANQPPACHLRVQPLNQLVTSSC